MGGVEEDGATELFHTGDGAHVADEAVVAEGGAALGEKDGVVAGLAEFFADIGHVFGGHELGFFDVDGFAGGGGGGEEVCLAAEEGGNLEAVEDFGGGGAFLGQVDVAEHGQVEGPADVFKDAESFFEPGAAEGVDGGAVGFVVGGLEDGGEAEGLGEGFDFFGDGHAEVARFDDARPGDEGQGEGVADGHVANSDF